MRKDTSHYQKRVEGMDTDTEKFCRGLKDIPGCGLRPLSMFSKGKGSKGLTNYCKECMAKYRQTDSYKESNRKRANEAYHSEGGREIQLERNEKWKNNNWERYRESLKTYRNKPEAKEKVLAYSRTETAVKNRREATRKHREKYVVTMDIHDGIRRCIRKYSHSKDRSLYLVSGHRMWESLLGFSLKEVVCHFESLFPTYNLTWEGYGSIWEIDHVIPKSIFDLDQIETVGSKQFKELWSLDNLRPYPKSMNRVKNLNIDH